MIIIYFVEKCTEKPYFVQKRGCPSFWMEVYAYVYF